MARYRIEYKQRGVMTHPTIGGITVIIILRLSGILYSGGWRSDPTCLSFSFPGLPLSSGNRLGNGSPLVQLKRLGFLLTSLSSLGQTYNSKVIKWCLCYRYPPLLELPPSSYCFSQRRESLSHKFSVLPAPALCTTQEFLFPTSNLTIQGAARVGYMILGTWWLELLIQGINVQIFIFLGTDVLSFPKNLIGWKL